MTNKSLLWPLLLIVSIILVDSLLTSILFFIFSVLSSPEVVATTMATDPLPNILFKSIGIVISLFAIGLYQLNISTREVRWQFEKKHLLHLFTGILLPIVLLCTLILFGQGFDVQFHGGSTKTPVLYLLLMLIVSFHEEIVFRFLPLIGGNHWISYLISSMIFTLVHIFNSYDLFFLINVFLLSIIISYGTWLTKNMVFPMLFHFSWNSIIGPILGLPVSGINMESWYKTSISFVGYYNNEIGPESSSILTYIFLTIIFLVIVFQFIASSRKIRSLNSLN